MPYYGGGSAFGGGSVVELGESTTSLDVFRIKCGNTEPYLRRTLVDAAGQAVDLSDAATVMFHMAVPGSAAKVNAACVIIDALGGVVEYRWVAADTDTVGSYRGEFRITRRDGRERTVPSANWLRVKVYTELAR